MGMFDKPAYPLLVRWAAQGTSRKVKGNGKNLDCYACAYHAHPTLLGTSKYKPYLAVPAVPVERLHSQSGDFPSSIKKDPPGSHFPLQAPYWTVTPFTCGL